MPAEAEPGGFEHFAVVVAAVHSFEWLHLRAAGHRRAHFEWREEAWIGDWIGA